MMFETSRQARFLIPMAISLGYGIVFATAKSRGMRKKADADDRLQALIESDLSSKALRRNRARLIKKIYQIDPQLCSKCSHAHTV